MIKMIPVSERSLKDLQTKGFFFAFHLPCGKEFVFTKNKMVFVFSECGHYRDSQLCRKVLTAMNRIHVARHKINANALRSITIMLCGQLTNIRKMIQPIRIRMTAINGTIYRIACGSKQQRLQKIIKCLKL